MPLLFDARRAVDNYGTRVADLQNKIRLESASSAATARATRVLGQLGGTVAAVIEAVSSAETVAQLEAQLTAEKTGLANAKTLVSKREQDISGYQWGIDNTPVLLARQGCPPL